jgi:hypothetical protein
VTSSHLLGFAAAAGAERLATALRAVPGGKAEVSVIGDVAVASATVAPLPRVFGRRDRATMLSRLSRSQRLMEEAALAGPFLPAAPNTAMPGVGIAAMVGACAGEILSALDGVGRLQQWDVTLRWQAEAVLAASRERIAAQAVAAGSGRLALADAVGAVLNEARLERLSALRSVIGGFAHDVLDRPHASEGEAGVTVLVDRSGDGLIEAALGRLAPAIQRGASADLRGPMPPVSFAAVTVLPITAREITDAWYRLGLPSDGTAIDGDGLARAWRRTAATIHPDIAGPGAPDLTDAKAAAGLLRRLLRGGVAVTRAQLTARAGLHLVIPEVAIAHPQLEAVA